MNKENNFFSCMQKHSKKNKRVNSFNVCVCVKRGLSCSCLRGILNSFQVPFHFSAYTHYFLGYYFINYFSIGKKYKQNYNSGNLRDKEKQVGSMSNHFFLSNMFLVTYAFYLCCLYYLMIVYVLGLNAFSFFFGIAIDKLKVHYSNHSYHLCLKTLD